MKKEDIEHLATLARIELSAAQVETFAKDFDDILGYVAEIKEVAGAEPTAKVTGVHRNIFREDVNPHPPGIYTEALLDAAPRRRGQYLEVKKILDTDAK